MVQFLSLTLNQSFLIYQRGFVSWRLMPAPIRGKKQHNNSEKARANPCSDAIRTRDQIRADLNRHRTQNHIKGNSMCMALHCSQSLFFCSSLSWSFPDFLSPLLPALLSICHHHRCWFSFFSALVTWNICRQRLLWAYSVSCHRQLQSGPSPRAQTSCQEQQLGQRQLIADGWHIISHNTADTW